MTRTPALTELDERGPDGHLSDVAIVAMADGQALSAQALAHAETCDACSTRVADAALLAADLHVELRALAEAAPAPAAALEKAPPRALPKQKSPAAYIGVALAIALLASLPTLGSLPRQATGLASGAKLQAAGIGQVGRAVVEHVSAPAGSLLLAALFIGAGVAVAVWGSKRERGAKHGFA
jgi:anti-sigma factor RsiW